MWNPIREILARYAIASSNETAKQFYINETAGFFSLPVSQGGYGMNKARVVFLLGEYARLLEEKKIKPLYYSQKWSEVAAIQKQFDLYVDNEKWIYTFFDGINKGLVNVLLFNPDLQRFESWRLVDDERSKEPDFDPLRSIRDYLTSFFGETFMQLLPYVLVVLIILIAFYSVRK